jgi:hypothetical protein
MSDHARDDWVQCPPGELGRLAARLQGRRRRRDFLRATALLPVVAIAIGAWLFWPKPTGTPEYNFAGITCSRVMELAEAYGSGTLSPELREQVRQHVAQCPDCGPRFKEMGLVMRIDHDTPRPMSDAGGYTLLASVTP